MKYRYFSIFDEMGFCSATLGQSGILQNTCLPLSIICSSFVMVEKSTKMLLLQVKYHDVIIKDWLHMTGAEAGHLVRDWHCFGMVVIKAMFDNR